VTEAHAAISSIERHHNVVVDLVRRVEWAVRYERFDDAARTSAVAADFASRHHCGMYADPDIERMLGTIGRSLPVPTADALMPSGTVVHVCSVDPRAAALETIARLNDGLSLENKTIYTDTRRPLESAAELRKQCAEAELVLVHSEPGDVVPSIAFGGWSARPPVVHVNHHETVFWLGVGIADLVLSHQATGSALAVDRRFIGVGRTAVLPNPLADVETWANWAAELLVRATSVHRAWLPEAFLPARVGGRDIEAVGWLTSSGRATGLRSCWLRHGLEVASPVRPDITAVVLGIDAVNTLDCFHEILSVAGPGTDTQLLAVDISGDPDFGHTMRDLGGLVTVVAATPGSDPLAAITAATRWSAAPVTAVLSDDVSIAAGAWLVAIERLDESGAPVPVEVDFGGRHSLHFMARSEEIDAWLDLALTAGVELPSVLV